MNVKFLYVNGMLSSTRNTLCRNIQPSHILTPYLIVVRKISGQQCLCICQQCTGALAFPTVRAVYLDGNKQSPSLQVVIEGAQSSGKGRFKDMFYMLFERVIKSDSLKLQSENPDNIIQITGTEVSRTRFQMILASNKGVHIYVMEPEIDAVTESIKKKGGFATELLRKAFSNENITQDSMITKPYARGSFPVYLNYTFTGTTKAIDRFFKEDEYEDGTASRVCFARNTGTWRPNARLQENRIEKTVCHAGSDR